MIVLITGISSGFGKAIAERLVAEGHTVYGTVRREVAPIDGVHYLHADVRDEVAVKAAFESLMAAEGRVDIFINNAGMGIGGPLEFCSVEDISMQMDVNFLGMVRWLAHIVPQMRRQRAGKIICLSSIGGLMGLPYQGAYSASKFAIEGYCQALRLELRGSGVRVVVVEPGDFSTGFTAGRKSVPTAEAVAAYPSYERSLRSIEHDENNGLRPEYLARRMGRIIRKSRPAYAYVVASPLQRLAVFAKWLLPKPLFAWVLALYYKL